MDNSDHRRPAPPSPSGAGIIGLLGRWELAALTNADRRRISRALFHEGPQFGPFARRFAALMTLSVLIAVMGLLADSTAVVIGAMLVAPLMTPVLGVAAALISGWPWRLLRSLVVSAIGAGGAIGLAFATSFAFPGGLHPLPGELVARTSPNLLDLGIALAAGAAGAYAQIRRTASDALTGVAVAVALVPPLAVVGICLQLQLYSFALGALLLFLANVVGIVLAASVTFLICGFVPGTQLQLGNRRIAGGMRWAAVAVIIMVLPLHFTRGSVLPATDPTGDVESALDDFVDDAGGTAELVDLSVERVDGDLVVDVVMTEGTRLPEADEIAVHLADELGETVDVRMQLVQVTVDTASADENEAEEQIQLAEEEAEDGAEPESPDPTTEPAADPVPAGPTAPAAPTAGGEAGPDPVATQDPTTEPVETDEPTTEPAENTSAEPAPAIAGE